MGNRQTSGSELCRDMIVPRSKSSGNDSSELTNLKVFQFLSLYMEHGRVPDPGSMELSLGNGSVVCMNL